MSRIVNFHNRKVDLDGIYYIYYSGEKRELSKLQRAQYETSNSLIFAKQNLDNMNMQERDTKYNPNVIPMTGMEFIDYANKNHMVPMFDIYFEDTKKVTLIPAAGIEYILQNSKKVR